MTREMETTISRSDGGFTLVELLIVIAIAAIVGTVATLAMRPLLSKYYLTAAVKQLSMDLLMYRARAISEGTNFRVTFDVANNRYLVDRETATGSGVWTNPDNLADANPLAVSAAPVEGEGYGIQFGASVVDGSSLTFSPRGLVTSTGASYLAAPGLSITNGYEGGAFTVSITGKIGTIAWS